MKRIYFSAILLFIINQLAFTQNWAPVGAKWTYNHTNGTFFPTYAQVWATPDDLEVLRDTVVNGITATFITGGFDCGSAGGNALTYESNGLIYFFNDSLQKFRVFFDFNKNVGDTFYMHIPFDLYYDGGLSDYGEDSLALRVDSIKYVVINGVQLKSMLVYQADLPTRWNFAGWFTERIGGLDFLFPIHGACDPPTADLRCYSDLSFSDYKPGEFQDCDSTYTWIVGIEKIENIINDFAVTENKISCSSKGSAEFNVYSVTGALQLEGLLSPGFNEVDLSNLSSGLYFFYCPSIKKPIKFFIAQN